MINDFSIYHLLSFKNIIHKLSEFISIIMIFKTNDLS